MWFVLISILAAALNVKAADSFHVDTNLTELEDDFFGLINSSLQRSHNLDKNLTQSKHVVSGLEVASACSIFIDANARLGEQGAYAINELVQHQSDYASLLSNDSLDEQCPNFPNLEVVEKAKVITLVLTAMAHFESRCQETVPNYSAPNGVARGLFQLHEGHEESYDGGADACVHNASMDADESIRCALGMLNLQFRRSGILFDPRSYWDVLRPNGQAHTTGVIGQAIARARLCQVGAR